MEREVSDQRISKKRKAPRYSDTAAGWSFISPWVIGFLLFSGVPIILSFFLSLTKWNLIGNPRFVGFDNYRTLFEANSGLGNTLKVTFIFTILNVFITVLMSLFLAILLNLKVKFVGIFQFFYFVPAVMPTVVMTSCMILMFNSQLGIVNYVLNVLGVQNPPNWMGNQNLIWVVVTISSIFTYATGQMMLIFSAALKEVPVELYEAASLDGASAWNKFVHVTLPSIAPMLLFNVVVATVNSFNGAFTLLFPLTGGGPGDATRVLSLVIYDKAFKSFNMGQASALAVILFIIVAIIGSLQFKMTDNKISY